MSSVLFILGAGASRDCGAPLMGDFLDVATDLFKSGQLDEEKKDFQMVFETIGKLQRVHSKAQLDLNNIESIFTALELGNVIGVLPGVESENIPLVISALKRVIVKTLEKRIKFPVAEHGFIIAPGSYTKFAKLLKKIQQKSKPKHSVSVITFNYDIALDIAMAREGIGPNYVIESSVTGPYDIELMKLHGSLNWFSNVASHEILSFHPKEYLTKYSAIGFNECFLDISNHCFNYFSNQSIDIDKDPIIVPPTWNKSDYHKMLTRVWSKAAFHLSEAEYIFIIGYSLPETDAFFRLLYALGSEGVAMFRKIVVFNPDVNGGVNERFSKMLGPGALAKYSYQVNGFAQSIDIISNSFNFEQ